MKLSADLQARVDKLLNGFDPALRRAQLVQLGQAIATMPTNVYGYPTEATIIRPLRLFHQQQSRLYAQLLFLSRVVNGQVGFQNLENPCEWNDSEQLRGMVPELRGLANQWNDPSLSGFSDEVFVVLMMAILHREGVIANEVARESNNPLESIPAMMTTAANEDSGVVADYLGFGSGDPSTGWANLREASVEEILNGIIPMPEIPDTQISDPEEPRTVQAANFNWPDEARRLDLLEEFNTAKDTDGYASSDNIPGLAGLVDLGESLYEFGSLDPLDQYGVTPSAIDYINSLGPLPIFPADDVAMHNYTQKYALELLAANIYRGIVRIQRTNEVTKAENDLEPSLFNLASWHNSGVQGHDNSYNSSGFRLEYSEDVLTAAASIIQKQVAGECDFGLSLSASEVASIPFYNSTDQEVIDDSLITDIEALEGID